METDQQVLSILRGIILGFVEDLVSDDVDADSDLKGELGIDSIAMFEIANEIEKQWDMKVSDGDIDLFTTVASVVTFIQAAAGKQGLAAIAEA